MKESIHKYFKVGICQFMAYPAALKGEDPDILERITRFARDDYFDALEITWIKDAEKRAKAAKILEASHMTVCYAAQPRLLTTGMNANHLDENERKKAEATLIEAVDEAKELGAKGIAFLSGKWEKATREESYAQLLKTTRNVCDYAKTKDMSVVLEVFDFDIAKASLIGPAPLAARFAADIRSTHTNFGLMIDLSHIPMTYETAKFVVRTLRPYLVHFHIGNTVCTDPKAPGYGDEHQRFGFPGGSNDTPQLLEFLRVLKDEGFFNAENPLVLSFEVKPVKNEKDEFEDSEVMIANAKRVLNRAWALLED